MPDEKNHKIIPPLNEGEKDPDELAHERVDIPNTGEEMDADDTVHSMRTEPPVNNEERDIDDLMHERGEEEEDDH